jgi:hypothetical protein
VLTHRRSIKDRSGWRSDCDEAPDRDINPAPQLGTSCVLGGKRQPLVRKFPPFGQEDAKI